MKTLGEVATFFSKAWQESTLKMGELSAKTGLSTPTLRGLLSGRKDSKLTTFFAVADQLGYEVIVVPKTIAQSLIPPAASERRSIKTLIGSAVSQTRKPGESE